MMMVVHELGHVLGAWHTGGTIQQVVLHPLAISRTDVLPNPSPAVVVWLGPIAGCTLPLLFLPFTKSCGSTWRNTYRFFVGFCLVANGAYIAFGSFSLVGDCEEMYRTGTPIWVMVTVGGLACAFGFTLWHYLGSMKEFLANPERVSLPATLSLAAALASIVLLEYVFSA